MEFKVAESQQEVEGEVVDSLSEGLVILKINRKGTERR